MKNQDSYEYEHDDLYCYPGSDVLINKLNITDAGILHTAEREITSLRMAEVMNGRWIRGKFDFEHLKRIHKFLFGDIYAWAGEVRRINISKGNPFCRAEFIDEQMNEIFERLKQENDLRDLHTRESIGKRLAYYMGEINAVHPFREGNGRAQRLFIEHLAHLLGWQLDYKKIDSNDMLTASIKAFDCDYGMLEELLTHALQRQE